MKHLVQFCLIFGLGFVLLTVGTPRAAQAQDMPACMDTDDASRGNPTATAAWWGRRSAEEKKYISELPCEERFIPMICIYLFEPDLRGCVNRRVAEFRGDRACAAKGHEILSEERAACTKEFMKSFAPPFTS